MGRYVKRDPDVTVSQEIIGTVIAATVMLGIWGLLVATIKGIGKLTKLAENKIKSVVMVLIIGRRIASSISSIGRLYLGMLYPSNYRLII